MPPIGSEVVIATSHTNITDQSDSDSEDDTRGVSVCCKDNFRFLMGVSDNVSIAKHTSKRVYKFFASSWQAEGEVILNENNLTTLIYLITPIVSMIGMGVYTWIRDTKPTIHLGNRKTLSINGCLKYCIMEDSKSRLYFSLNDLVEMHSALFKVKCKCTHGVIREANIPCIFSHSTVEDMAKCKACGGGAPFKST
jgi:hypothetical protein